MALVAPHLDDRFGRTIAHRQRSLLPRSRIVAAQHPENTGQLAAGVGGQIRHPRHRPAWTPATPAPTDRVDVSPGSARRPQAGRGRAPSHPCQTRKPPASFAVRDTHGFPATSTQYRTANRTGRAKRLGNRPAAAIVLIGIGPLRKRPAERRRAPIRAEVITSRSPGTASRVGMDVVERFSRRFPIRTL